MAATIGENENSYLISDEFRVFYKKYKKNQDDKQSGISGFVWISRSAYESLCAEKHYVYSVI